MLETKSPSRAWKVMTDFYVPKTIMEKRRVAQEFDSISMAEGEDPVEYLRRIDKTVQKLATLGGTKDDDVNVHIVQNLSASYEVEKKIRLSSPGLTRSNIEESETRTCYTSRMLARVRVRRREMTYMVF